MDTSVYSGLEPMLCLTNFETITENDFLKDVLEGLSGPGQKTLPCKYFYDRRGSQLFDQICHLEEYYITRTELELLRRYASDMASTIGERAQVIELGSGSSTKIRLLLDALTSVASYVPVDISTDHLAHAAERMAEDYPDLLIQPVSADYTKGCDIPSIGTPDRRVAFFPGSTIGNFCPEEAQSFLKTIHDMVGPGSGLLIGIDLKKESAILDAAYNDQAGVTAAFNTNLIRRIRQELASNISEDSFQHHAFFNQEKSRIEMHLRARHSHDVNIGGYTIRFQEGETIHTENSYKYSLDEVKALAQQAGFRVERCWVDERDYFSIHFLST